MQTLRPTRQFNYPTTMAPPLPRWSYPRPLAQASRRPFRQESGPAALDQLVQDFKWELPLGSNLAWVEPYMLAIGPNDLASN